ncbi:host specificity factor TipJ family phage tail protein [Aliihoeflea sp. PC F10.4]
MIGPRVLILSSALDQSPRSLVLDRPRTVGEIVAMEKVPLGLPTIAVMTNPAGQPEPVMRGAWHVRQVTNGHQLAFVPVPGKGALSGVLAAVASIALSIFAPWAAGALAGMMGFTAGTTAFSIAAGVIGAGIMIAGQFILSRLMPNQQSPSAETVYTARASGNRAMPLEPIPVLYGRLRYPPPYAARPYGEFIDNDQYLYQLHCMGIGDIDVQRWEIGDTLVWSKDGGFTTGWMGGDTQIQIIRPGGAVTLFPANVVSAATVDGQQVPDAPNWLGPFAVSAPGTQVTRIACDYVFPLGLVSINKKGGGDTLSRQVFAEYRPIDYAGNALDAFRPLFSRNHSAKTRTPQRFSSAANVPAGRYEVRLGASGADEADAAGGPPTRLNRVVWGGLRGYVPGFQTPADVTLIATRIRANEQISREASGQYLFTGQRLLPVRRNGVWTAPEATRNPAWAVADLMKRLGLLEHEYDLGWLTSYANLWEDRGDEFDGLFDRRWQASEAIDAILRVGRAYHVRLGSIIGFVRDEPKQVRRMAFTPDTIVAGSIQRHDVWFSEDAPDHLEVNFLDGDTWRDRSVLAAIGAVGQDKPQELSLFGITDHDHAWREGIFQAGENAFRRSFRTFQCEREGRMLVRGDPVVLHDPLHELVGFGRIEARSANVLTLDRELDHPGGQAIVAIRSKVGTEWGPCRVDSVVGNKITLNQADRITVEGRHGTLTAALADATRQEPAHATVLRIEERLFDGLVVEARAIGSELWDVTLVNDDQRCHAVDRTEVIPSPWTPPDLLAPVPDRPVLSDLYAAAIRGTMSVELQAGWRAAAGADRYVAEISYDDGAIDDPAEANWTPVHDSAATRLNVAIAPQPVTVRVAPIGRLRGAWVYRHVADIPNLQLPDEIEDEIQRRAREWIAEMIDWLDSESPLFGLGELVTRNAEDIAAERADRLVDIEQLGALVYGESETRAAADAALGQLIDGVAARLDDPATGIDALAQAQSTLLGRVDFLDEGVSANARNIDDAVASIAGKADVAVTDSLAAEIAALDNGDQLSMLGQAIRAIRLTTDRLALANAGTWLAGEKNKKDLSGIVADVSQTVTSRIDITENSVTLIGAIVDRIELDLGGKASVSAVDAVVARVEATESGITAMAQGFQQLTAQVGAVAASITVKSEVMASPGGGRARWALTLDDGVDAAFPTGLLVEREGGIGTIGALANSFYFYDAANRFRPVIIQNGTLIAEDLHVYFARVLGTLEGNRINARTMAANRLILNGIEYTELANGAVTAVAAYDQPAPLQINSDGPSTIIAQTTISGVAGRLRIIEVDCNAASRYTADIANDTKSWVFEIRRGTTVIKTFTETFFGSVRESTSGTSQSGGYGGHVRFRALDYGGAANQQYTVYAGTAQQGLNSRSNVCSDRYMTIQEVRA